MDWKNFFPDEQEQNKFQTNLDLSELLHKTVKLKGVVSFLIIQNMVGKPSFLPQ